MEERTAERVVELLRGHRVFATVKRAGVYRFGVRVVLRDGREALWDTDGAAGLEAMVLRDGVLVGFVPPVPDSDDLPDDRIAAVIAGADYDATLAPAATATPTASPSPVAPPSVDPPSVPTPAQRPSPPPRRGFLQRLIDRVGQS